MASNSFGTFGTFKYKYIEDTKNNGFMRDMRGVTHGTAKDLAYFEKSLSRNNQRQVVDYTWQKPYQQSASIHRPHNIDDVRNRSHKNTLELMATYVGNPHVVKQNKWETGPTDPPNFFPYPQTRRTNVLSSMNQYVEEMSKTFPGVPM